MELGHFQNKRLIYSRLEHIPDKIQLLTILPMSLSQRNIEEEFDCSRHLVKVSKNLLSKRGAVSRSGPKQGCLYNDCNSCVLCKSQQPNCYSMNCSACPGIDTLKNKLHEFFRNSEMEDCNIEFNQCVLTDRKLADTKASIQNIQNENN